MSDRESIFKRVRASLAKAGAEAPLPEYELGSLVAKPRLKDGSLWQNFARNFAAVSGRPMEGVDEAVSFLKAEGATCGYCDPALESVFGSKLEKAGISVVYAYDREAYEDYQFGITRATGGIAETGTVVLTDSDTSHRLGALTPWVHIAVLGEEGLVETVSDAIAAFKPEESNTIWATGPSKTADIEGILIEGVHGPGEQVCLLLAE